ncbi:MAG: site-specific integrase [Eubacteriales bacterium]|nr:site-specific integrase [Eubacteriales bacterium]
MAKNTYGNGSIYYSKPKEKWVGQIKVGIKTDGKINRRTVYGKTKKEVKEKIKRIQAEVITGVYKQPSELTIPDLANSINDNKKALNQISDTAHSRNKETIKIIENDPIALIPIQKINEVMLNQFLAKQVHYSNSVIGKIYSMCNRTFKKAISMDIISKNPLDEIKTPKSTIMTKKIKALTIQQQKKFINAVNEDNKEPYRTMLLLELFTGMRMGEICALSPHSIYFNNSLIEVTRTMTRDAEYKTTLNNKTKTYAGLRRIKVDKSVMALLKSYTDNYFAVNEYNLLFTKNGNMISTNQVNSYYKRLIERYNIADNVKKCNQHQLRHTYATRSIESGMPAKVLQYRLGHSDITITLNTYCDVFSEYEDTYIDKTQEYLSTQGIAI